MREEQVVWVPSRFMLSLKATGTPAKGQLGNIARSDGGINTCRRGQGRFFSGFEESMYRLVGRYDTCQGVFCNFLGAEFFGSKACWI